MTAPRLGLLGGLILLFSGSTLGHVAVAADEAPPAQAPIELDLGELDVPGRASLPATFAEDQPGGPPANSSSVTPLGDRAGTLISGEALAGATTLGAVLDRVSGIDVRADGGAGQLSTVHIRGARANQALVLMDGMPLPGFGTADLALLPLGNVERVEILRGPAGATYGPGALGGVLNIITRSQPQDAAQQLVHEDLTIQAGSFGNTELAWSRYAPHATWHFSHLDSENNYNFQRTGGGRAQRQNNRAETDRLDASWKDAGWDWRAGLVRLDRGVPGSGEFPATQARLHEWAGSLAGRSQRRVFGTSYISSHFNDPAPYLHAGPLDSRDWRWHAELANLVGTGAAQEAWAWRVRTDAAGGDSAGNALRSRAGLDLTHTWQGRWSDRLTWQGNAGVTGSTGIGIDPLLNLVVKQQCSSNLETYAALDYNVRHPDFAELYMTNTGGVRGNPQLHSERVWNLEAGLNSSNSRASVQAAAFYSRYDDSILFLPVSAYLVEARNTGKATVAGIEAAWQQNLGPRSSWDCACTWLAGAEMADGTPLAQRAPLHATGGVDCAVSGWDCRLAADYAARTPVDLNGNLRVPARVLFDLTFDRQLAEGQFSCALTNLTGVSTRDSWNYPLPGREITLSWRTSL